MSKHLFWKDGDYQAQGGIYVRNDLKKSFNTLAEKGLNPVGVEIDDESFNLQVIVEYNQAYKDLYETDNQQIVKP